MGLWENQSKNVFVTMRNQDWKIKGYMLNAFKNDMANKNKVARH